MPSPTPNQVLTRCAEHVRSVYGPEPAALIEVWRDRHHPDSPSRPYHRWAHIGRHIDGAWTRRRCAHCGTTERVSPMAAGGPHITHYLLPDGSTVKKSHRSTPECRPLSAAALSTNQPTKD